jgi:hypothetical protein
MRRAREPCKSRCWSGPDTYEQEAVNRRFLVIVWLCQVSFFLHPYSDIGLLGFIHVTGVIFNLLMLRFTSFDSRGGYSCALFRRGARGHHSFTEVPRRGLLRYVV